MSMADKIKPKIKQETKQEVAQPVQKKKRFVGVFKLIAMFLVLLMLASAAFAAGVYFKIFDLQHIASQWGLDKYPLIGHYFEQPKTNFETVDEEQASSEQPPVTPQEPVKEPQPDSQNTQSAATVDPAKTLLDKEKLEKARQQEEAKRAGKLARFYGNMKPDEAAAIMKQLDDSTIIAILNKMEEDQAAQVLAKFDAQRAANLTDQMFKGRKDTVL
ncbi:MgtE intracellular N domain-containing protein [Propionispora hippei DSM 15287]|uniref:MgtE intracellular N domain-containing protein n=2 Tax=Propionispora TaxID=112902 RepID=A0A1M6D2Y2_9FIRM|nr:MgtE intracellular N domain-containing protein [Propionispora hippei DSM 15287]